MIVEKLTSPPLRYLRTASQIHLMPSYVMHTLITHDSLLGREKKHLIWNLTCALKKLDLCQIRTYVFVPQV